jgi:hypothetical protein
MILVTQLFVSNLEADMNERIRLTREIASLEAKREEHYAQAKACGIKLSVLKHCLATLPSEPTRKGRNWTEKQKQAQSERTKERWQRAKEGTAGEEE